MIIVALSTYFMIVAKSILIPIVFAVLLSMLLLPVKRFYKRYIKSEGLAILATMASAVIPIAGVLTFFSIMLADIVASLPSITRELGRGVQRLVDFASQYIDMKDFQIDEFITSNLQSIVTKPLNFLQNSLVSSTSILMNLALTLLYTVFLLYYINSFKNFIVYQMPDKRRGRMKSIIASVNEMTKQYLQGLALVIVILSVLNSIGLWIIGIDYPLFWGCLAGMLAIIPFIGTTLGGLLPFLYALATLGFTWQPLAVVIFYFAVQQLEGNFITPKIVGDKVDINPLVAIISVLIFNSIWGLAGIVLALPAMGIVRIVLEHIDITKPLAILLSSDIQEEENIFETVYNKDKYRFISLFKEDKKNKNKKESTQNDL